METDAEGKLSFKGLQYGHHVISEISVMDGYLLNENVIEFEVAEENEITLTSKIDQDLGKVDFDVTPEGNISLMVEDQLSPGNQKRHNQ